MKKNYIIPLLIVTFLVNFININSMNPEWYMPRVQTKNNNFALWELGTGIASLYDIFNPIESSDTTEEKEKYKKQSDLNSIHNCNNVPLLQLPHDTLKLIMPEPCIDTTMPLKDVIKTSLLLKTTCKRFNDIFTPEAIGKACQIYSKKEKNKLMEELLKSMNSINYWSYKRQVALTLIYAATDNIDNANKILEKSVYCNDQVMVEVLLKNHADPNYITDFLGPIFFYIKTIPMAKSFISHGLDVNTTDSCGTNVLWKNISDDTSHELIALYISHKADVKKIEKKKRLVHIPLATNKRT